jgi:PAS domain S-box-containing protein
MLSDLTLYEQTPALLHTLDVEGCIRIISDRWLEVLEYEREAVVGRHWHSFLTPNARSQMTRHLPSECWLTGSVQDLRVEFQTRTGKVLDISLSANLLCDEAGHPTHCVAVCTDITDILATQRKLATYRERLEQRVSDLTLELQATTQQWQQEILQRQQVEAELRQSEARYRASFEHAAIGVVHVTTDGPFQASNQYFQRFLGYTQAELANLTVSAITHPDDRTIHREPYQRLLRGEIDQFTVEKRYLRKDGNAVWAQTTVSVVRDDEGTPLFFPVIVQDISDLKAAELALRESEALFRLIAETINEHLWIDDVRQHRPIYDSPHFEALWEMPRTTIQNGFESLLAKVHPDDRAAFQAYLDTYAVSTTKCDVEYRVIRKDGAVRWLRSRTYPLLDDQGYPYRVVGSTTDITDHKHITEALQQSEERFQLMITAINVYLWMDDARTQSPIYNGPNLEKVWGIPPSALQENLQPLIDCVHPDDRLNFTTWIAHRHVVTTPFNLEFRIQHAQLGLRWLYSEGFPILDDQGRPERVTGIMTDITERKLAEQTLQRYERIIAATPDALCLIDRDYRLILWNPAYADLFQLGAESQGHTIAEIFGAPFFANVSQQRLDRALAGETQYYEEWIFNPFSDTDRFISITYAPYYETDGSISGVVNLIRDITALKQTSDRLTAATERLRLHIDNSPLAVIEWDNELRVQDWSEQAEQLFGWSATDALGRSISELSLFSGVSQIEIETYAHQLGAEHRTHQIVLADNLTQSGESIWCEWYNSALLDEAGNLISILSLVHNVTERHQAQIALRESEERWQLALLGSNQGMWDWKISTDEVWYSPRWKELLGYTDSELPNTKAIWSSHLHPEDWNRVSGAMQAHLRGETEFYTAEYRMRHRAGHDVWIHARGKATFDEAGNPIRFVGSHSNVSDRKQMELEMRSSQYLLQLVLDTMPQRVFWKDLNGRFLGCNRAFAADMGYADTGEIIGRTDVELMSLTPEAIAEFLAHDRAVLEGGERIFCEEQPQHHIDGTQRWVITTKLPLKTETDECIGVFGSYEDVTERKTAQMVLHRYARMVEAATDAICLVDCQCRYLLINRTYAEWYGYHHSEIIGHTVTEILGQEAYETRLKPLIDRCLKGETIRYAQWFDFPHLGRRFRSVTLTPYREDDGNISGFVTSIRDLTALKDSEARQQELLEIIEATPDFVCMATPAGELVYVNPALQRCFATFPGDPSPQHWSQVYAVSALTQLQDTAIPIAMRQGTWQGESLVLTPQGEGIPVAQTITAHLDDRGNVKLLSTIAHDIRTQKALETQLRDRLEYEQLVRRVSTLFANLPSADLQVGVTQALHDIAVALGVGRGYVYRISPDQTLGQLYSQWCTPALSPIPLEWATIPVAPFSWWMSQLNQQQVVAIAHAHDLPDLAVNERHALLSLGTQACAVVPLFHHHTLIGYMGLSDPQPKVWKEEEIACLKLMGDLFANAYQRQQADESLRLKELYFRALTERSSDLVMLLDREYGIQYATPSIQWLLGYVPTDYLGKWVTDFVAPADLPAIQTYLHTAAAHPGISQPVIQYRVRHKEGHWRYHEAIATSLLEDPNVQGIVVNSRDVSDRIQAELAQRQSEQSFKALFEQAAISMAQITLDGHYIRVNPAFCVLVGYPAEALIGEHYAKVTHPDDLDYDTQLSNEVASGAVSAQFIQKRFLRSDGAVRHVQVAITAVQGDADAPAFLASVYNDITDRIVAETALRTVLEGTAATVGEDFFPALAQHLSRSLAVDHLLINECQPNGTLTTLVFWSQGTSQPCFSYAIDQSPCERTLRDGFFYCPEQLQTVFPEDPDLVTLNAHSYLGLALTNRVGAVIGEICALHHTQIPHPENAVALMQIFAARASAELERQRAHQALEASEAINRAIVNALPDVLIRMRRDGLILKMAAPSEFPVVAPAESAIGRNIVDLLPSAIARQRLELTNQALTTQQVQITEFEIAVQGQLRWEESRIVPLSQDEVLVLIRDIDERKRAEQEIHRLNAALAAHNEQLEALVEQRTAELVTFINSLPDQIFVVQRDELLMAFTNDVMAYFAGQADRRELEGRSIFEIFPRDQAAYYAEQNRQVFETGQVLHVEEAMEGPDGMIYLDTYKIPLQRPDGEVYALIGTSRNITELVRGRQKLEQQTTQLEATNQELQSFSYSVSHDLRAPLRHMNGFITALRQHLEEIAPLDERTHHYISVIERSSQKMGLLIDGILTLSRVGRRKLTLRPVPLEPLVEQAIDLLEEVPLEDGDRLQITLDPLPTVQGDPVLLQQVFSNLIENALKFSRDRRPALIHIGQRPDGVFFVQDNGVGFDMTYADKLFSPFQRLHRQEEFKGTGIGLAIVNRIIHRHGGHIWAESAIDQGTTFFFTLGASPLAISES